MKTITQDNLEDAAEWLGGEVVGLVDVNDFDPIHAISLTNSRGEMIIRIGDIITMDNLNYIKILRPGKDELRFTGRAPRPKNHVTKRDLSTIRRVADATRKQDTDE